MSSQNSDIKEYFKDIIRSVIREENKIIEENKPKPQILYNSKESINYLNISESTFRRLIKNGTIKSFKVNGRIRVKHEDLQALLSEVKSLKYKR
jgi:excisionase family DNA binding protein